jgi:threonine dehydratase
MLVSDADLRRAIVTLLRTTRQLAEGAGAAPLAAAILRRDELRGKTIGLVISGGNITVEQLREILDE